VTGIIRSTPKSALWVAACNMLGTAGLIILSSLAISAEGTILASVAGVPEAFFKQVGADAAIQCRSLLRYLETVSRIIARCSGKTLLQNQAEWTY
jgi:hypothetical protein